MAALIALIFIGAFGVYRFSNQRSGSTQVQQSTLISLAQAKDALITYAVFDTSRPGRLPCPAAGDDGITPLFTLNDCPSYSGWLPWKTLDIPQSKDPAGQTFRYYLSPAFGGNRITQPLNSDTLPTLHLDVAPGAPSNDIVAVLVATGSQEDDLNSDGDTYYFNGRSGTASDNDLVVGITRQELMALVEQRIANELRSCLEQHSNAALNTEKTYPWPAPLASAGQTGTTTSLFGRVPDTQPANPEALLKEQLTKLRNTTNTLNATTNPGEQFTRLTELQTQAVYARTLFDRVFINAADLVAKADIALQAFDTLDNAIVAATVSKSVYETQGNSLPGAITSAAPALRGLIDALANGGFDVFSGELQLQTPTLASKLQAATLLPSSSNFDALITPVNRFKNALLEYSYSPNATLNAALGNAYAASVTAAASINAARKNATAPFTTQALSDTSALLTLLQGLETAILAQRITIDPNEILFRAAQLQTLLSTPADGTDSLLTQIRSATALINRQPASNAQFSSLIQTTLSALVSAEQAALPNGTPDALATSTASAITQLTTLATALARSGDNIALEAIKLSETSLNQASANLPTTVTGAKALRAPVKTILYWAEIASAQAADIARLARKGVNSTNDSDTSAYTAARRFLDSLDGEAGSLALLERSKDSPTEENIRAAQSALANSMALLSTMLSKAEGLDNAMSTGFANAGVPTQWISAACNFLNASGSSAWWSNNGWKSIFFYQISSRVRPNIGSLRVNGTGYYRVIALSAGRALAQQDRSILIARNYLEKANADISRDGTAQSPSPLFVNEPTSAQFNDRLAY